MGAGDKYRVKAQDLRAKAAAIKDEKTRIEYENAAVELLRLAAEVDRKPGLIVNFELPPEGEGKTKH